MKKIKEPEKYSVVQHSGWGMEKPRYSTNSGVNLISYQTTYPCDVLIIEGSFMGDRGVSNFWSWKPILDNNQLGETESGYGDFYESHKDYEVNLTIHNKDKSFSVREIPVPVKGVKNNKLKQEIETVLNKHSAENESNTPDFILAKYLMGCLEAFNDAIRSREKWYGNSLKII